ncbi:Transmembrane protein 18, partial [Globisporangium splendens]
MEHVLPQIKRELQSKYSHMMIQWYEAVNWTEPLVVGALCFHALLFLAVFLSRKRLVLQFALFAVIILMVLVTEPLNKWSHANWKSIATQNYFDPRGVFIGIFYAGPLLAAGFFQLLLSMKNMIDMVILVKRAEFQQHHKQEQQNSSKTKNE